RGGREAPPRRRGGVRRAGGARSGRGRGGGGPALPRRFGVRRFMLIENAVQDAYVRALERWPNAGSPVDPERWLIQVAHNALVDALRREPATDELDAGRAGHVNPPPLESDDELGLVCLCCNAALARAAQLALVLNVAFGLTARQIATAFVSDERTVAQRIVRAKQRLCDEGLGFDMPEGEVLPERLAAI